MNKKYLNRIIDYIKRFIKLIILIVILGVAISLLEGVGVTLVAPLLHGIGGSGSLPETSFFNHISKYFSGMGVKERVQIVALLMVLIMGVKSILSYIYELLSVRLQQETVKYYRMLSFKQLMKLKMGFFNAQQFGKIQTIVFGHAQSVGLLLYDFIKIVPNILTIGLFLYLLFILNWKMTVVSCILILMASLVLRRTSHKINKASKEIIPFYYSVSTTLFDTLRGMKVIKLFNREKNIINRFSKNVEDLKITFYNMGKAKALALPLFEFIGVASMAIIMILGTIILDIYGKFSLQILLIFMFVFLRIMPKAKMINQTRFLIAAKWPFMDALYEFLEEKDELYIKNGTREFNTLNDGIEMRNVSFSYDVKEKIVLKNVSCFFPKGIKIGIVGFSGGGKSTIIELLSRFYDPQEGQILVDGINLRELDINSWRNNIGVVNQDTFLFNDTIRANIAFAKHEATKEEIDKAVIRSHASEFIKELPLGLDTIVGERGVCLSGGQKQRIAIARAILKDPGIIIFDEATSSLDTESEELVKKAIDEISEGKTIITIAHRLSTVSNSDIIFVVVDGCIVQQGNPKTLVEQDGYYKRLFELQVIN